MRQGIMRPEKVNFLPSLPKTRANIIPWRILKVRTLGQDVGDLSTLET
jgi:acetyl-CoA synthetase